MSDQPKVVPCRSCKASMYWVTTKNGKPMPVDAKPDPKGGLVLTLKQGDKGAELHAEAYSPTETTHQNKRNRYTSHFVTCPQRNEHRRPR